MLPRKIKRCIVEEEGFGETWKEMKEALKELRNTPIEKGEIYGGSFFSTDQYRKILKKAPEKYRKLLERHVSDDIDIIVPEKNPEEYLEVAAKTKVILCNLYTYVDAPLTGVPTMGTGWSGEVREKVEEVKGYLRFKKLKKGYFKNIYRNDPLGKLKKKIVKGVADRYADATSTAILKLPYEGCREKDVKDVGRLMLASMLGMKFDRERFNRAAEHRMGENWREKMEQYFSEHAPEYLEVCCSYINNAPLP